MAFSFISKKNRIVNLVFKDYVIRYAEMKQVDPPVVAAMGERYLPSGLIKEGKILDYDALKFIVEQCLHEWGFSKRQVRFLVPDPFVVIRKMAIDAEIEEDEIEGYLYLEMGTTIHLPFEDPIFDWVLMEGDSGNKEILLFAASEEQVMQYSNLLEDNRLEPIAADISSLALYRLCHLNGTQKTAGHLLVLEWDVIAVTATIFVDDRPVFMRHILLPDEIADWELLQTGRGGEETLGFQGDRGQYFQMLEDTYVEIERLLTFYKYNLTGGQDAVDAMLITGDHPDLLEIRDKLSAHLDLSIDLLEENLESESGPVSYRYHSAAGLALKGVQ